MTNSSSYPVDDATRAITGCTEMIFEIESASEGLIRVDFAPAPMSPYPRPSASGSEDRICHTPTTDATHRRGLRAWLKRAVVRRSETPPGPLL